MNDGAIPSNRSTAPIFEDTMKDTINIEVDYTVFEYDDLVGKDYAAIKELLTAALEHGRSESKEPFNIQLTISGCK